ncbi:hypothetical protein L3V16_21070 [Brucella ciceri]|uniref:hypothetical protein n=1 Tax=Brucella ciceri TaxID=391287 RepID=UPI000DE29BD9|nr:hypothetical protein [Brucella ciceri]MCH6206319.1 hypothetical protein [Brucella ciceri]
MHANKLIYLRLRDMLHVSNGRMASMMGVSEETARAYGNPSNVRHPSIARLRQPIVESGKLFRDLQADAEIKPIVSTDDLERMADRLIEKLKSEAAQ